ncbi:MAG: hypothetical protein N3G80_02865 [Candidatus Micrarchaeota archaeon]|nr:hypothetical protein [Candidatus Micrarchaeota archaeon]
MRIIQLLMFALLVSALFAQNYSAQYAVEDWFKISRTITQEQGSLCISNGISNACMNSGAIAPPALSSPRTKVTLVVENVGSITRTNITIGENILYIPPGAKVEFSPSPSASDGKTVYWSIPQLAPGQSKKYSYEFDAALSESDTKRLSPLLVVAEPVLVYLSAPSSLQVGSRIDLVLKTIHGEPVAGAAIAVEFADGSRQLVKTNSQGIASFDAKKAGFYTYTVEGYKLAQPISTSVFLKEEQKVPPSAAASVADKGLISALSGIFPVFAAIFAIAIIALILYNFIVSSKNAEEALPPAESDKPKQPQQAPQLKEEEIKQVTRDIIESRKRQLEEKKHQEEPKPMPLAPEEGEVFRDVEQELQNTHQEIDKAISELEALRQKLRHKLKEQKEKAEKKPHPRKHK